MVAQTIKAKAVPVEFAADDKLYGTARFVCLALHFAVIMLNTHTDIYLSSDNFRSMCGMSKLFLFMELIILYVGNNRYRMKPSIFNKDCVMHLLACIFLNALLLGWWSNITIWFTWYAFNFLPLIVEISVALYTADN